MPKAATTTGRLAITTATEEVRRLAKLRNVKMRQRAGHSRIAQQRETLAQHPFVRAILGTAGTLTATMMGSAANDASSSPR